MDRKPRILVFTVASWNDKVGSNTWASLLDGYPSERIANICIRDEQPNSNVCSRYFRISENRIIKSLVNRKIKTGEEVYRETVCEDIDLEAHNNRYQIMKKHRRYSMLMVRELIWKVGRWKTPELDVFLDDFKPDIILHSMEGYIHLNRIIEYTIKRTGAKAIGYIWDDNFTYKQSKKVGYKTYRFFQRMSLKRLSKYTDEFFAISPMTKKEADEFFHINCTVLTKPLSSIPHDEVDVMGRPISIIYTGKLVIGRDNSLKRIVDIIRARYQGEFVVDVYTNSVITEELKILSDGLNCNIYPPVPQKEVLDLQRKSDVMLFLEDMDGEDALTARLSFSTKMTDYLSSGKCILALGHRDTAPMQYFVQNNAALVASSDEEIICCLEKLLNEKEEIAKLTVNAIKCAKEKHDPKVIKSKFWKVIFGVLK